MSKTFESKKKILDLLARGAKTPSDISRQLGLSPSTVSQHLRELRESGKVEEFQDEHFKNIKYYRRAENLPILSSSAAKFTAGVLVIAVLALLVVSFVGHNTVITAPTGAANQTSNVGIFITDPPQVPSGTQSLIVSYSSLKAQITNNSGTFWDSINGSGSINLISLVNFTKNLTTFKLPSNSIIDRLSLTISNASITVNGTTYPVVVTNNNVSVKVFYNSQNNIPFDILFDMFPTVSAVISKNQTIFVMAPSATAATIGKKDNPYYQNAKGQPAHLNYQEELALNQSRSKISIVNASISTSGNQSSISIELADDSNQSSTILGVVILGNESYELKLNLSNNSARMMMPNPRIPYNATNPNSNATRWQNWRNAGSNSNYTPSGADEGGSENFSPSQGGDLRIWVNGSSMNYLMNNLSNGTVKGKINWIIRARGFGNLSANFTGNVLFGHIVADIRSANYIQSRLEDFKTLNLFVAQNGTLLLPMSRMMYGPAPNGPESSLIGPNAGYNLSAGRMTTLKYSGSLSLGNGQLGIQFKPGDTYQIIVIGSGYAYANINVTAS